MQQTRAPIDRLPGLSFVLGVDVNQRWEMAVKKDSPAEVMPGPLSSAGTALAADPLPFWNDGRAKQSILRMTRDME